MGTGKTEACGRCSMSSVIDLPNDEQDEEGRTDRDPFAGPRIEISEAELRKSSGHVVLAGRVKRRLDDFARRVVYGR